MRQLSFRVALDKVPELIDIHQETRLSSRLSILRVACILVPRALVSFGHVVGETEGSLVTAQIKRVALETRMGRV